MREKLIDRFIRYARIDTQSDPNSETTPSTQKQFDLAYLLADELKALGVEEVEVTNECFVYANIPSNIDEEKIPNIGFVAHIDTTPDFNATGVNPKVIENYDGNKIKLGDTEYYLDPEENPDLKRCIGHTIIVTDGTTLLSSDDKSGVSAIMTLAEILINDDTIKHGNIKIAFTPDEEIGRGADKFDIKRFDCEYAYTIDGGLPGALNKETFSADSAIIKVYGKEIHPGEAKGRMINTIRIMSDIISKLPKDMAPETTEGNQPFIHPHSLKSGVSYSELLLILRDFNTEGLTHQKNILEKIIEDVKITYPDAKMDLKISKTYRNMLDELEKNPKGLKYLFEAAEKTGTNPFWEPIRGGTDGSKLTEMGLPTPNIYTGGQNFHSNKEWLSINFLEQTVETMLNLVKIWAEKE